MTMLAVEASEEHLKVAFWGILTLIMIMRVFGMRLLRSNRELGRQGVKFRETVYT